MEENKKRMEELNLTKLAQAVRNATSPKPSPPRGVDLSAVRRSNRVADKPPPNHRELLIEPLGRPRSYKRRDLLNLVYATDEDRQYDIEGAEQLQSDFDADFPSSVKTMLQSHVTGEFWLGLPDHFCKTHLPKHDEYATLIDENGDETDTKYLVYIIRVNQAED
ncbi:unnamed protein product [Withania somnifera]